MCGNLPWVDVHSALYEIYFVVWCCMDLWLIREEEVGSLCHRYICILLYMTLMQCYGVA